MTRSRLTNEQRRVRDEQIVAEFAAGRSQLSLANEHGLTRRQIGNITRTCGIRFRRGERFGLQGGGYSLRLNSQDRRRYTYLRDQYGAQRACEMMGIVR